MTSDRIAHLGMIQGVVNRLAMNSFLLKGWSVTLVVALLAFSPDDDNLAFVMLAYLPVAAFWGLDGYFLQQERLFRALYDFVRTRPEQAEDFTMNTGPLRGTSPRLSWVSASFSRTLVAFHSTLLAAVVVAMVTLILHQDS